MKRERHKSDCKIQSREQIRFVGRRFRHTDDLRVLRGKLSYKTIARRRKQTPRSTFSACSHANRFFFIFIGDISHARLRVSNEESGLDERAQTLYITHKRPLKLASRSSVFCGNPDGFGKRAIEKAFVCRGHTAQDVPSGEIVPRLRSGTFHPFSLFRFSRLFYSSSFLSSLSRATFLSRSIESEL